MAVLVYAESWNGSFKKATFEAVSYAAQLANKIGTDAIAITIANTIAITIQITIVITS